MTYFRLCRHLILGSIYLIVGFAAASADTPATETDREQAAARAAELAPVSQPAMATPRGASRLEAVTHPLFVGVDDSSVPAYQIDPATAGAIVAFTGYQVWGAAYDAANNRVFFNNGSTLYEWPVGGIVTQLGTIVDGLGATQAMVGLAFHGGTLYGVKNISNEAVWIIDPVTLVATVFIDYEDADFDFGGLAADPTTGELYGTNDDTTPFGSGLFRINLDGTATKITDYPVGETDIDGLAISPDRIAYLVTDEPGLIYPYDLAAGTYLTPFANPWTTAEVFSGATWIVDQEPPLCPSGPEDGELTAQSPTFNRPVGFGGGCSPSGVGTNVHYAVYSYNMGGPAPHDLFASTVGGTSMDTVLVFYQAADGSANPFNPGDPCANSVAYNDDFGGTLQSQISAADLLAGWVDVVLTTFANDITGSYTMDVSSQSCQSQPGAAIELVKTVGTDPTVCAVTDEIAVPAGATVYYCFEVTNTGDLTLNFHDLDDSELGSILSGFAYALTPGASAFITQSATIAVTTVNTATWTAYNEGPADETSAQASATVNVLQPVMVTVLVGTPGGGTVSGGGPYNVGDDATVEAFPTAGWVFLHWLVNGGEITDNPYTFEVTGDVTLTAIFQRQVAEPIPTTGTVGLILLLGLLLGVGVFVLRRMA